ncbi:membrane-spanning 4-domains subfamily A member 14 [Rousettus aegyptiacus]|uniref:Membrane spanning 4-domains A14 n=1 Tax=Rousettus aegyptiacus TaxID=9407 RepID=A0A7J8H3P5_ROUAE|nr:membrane-spanning 4-domains subfamily A member 14 [Rousettus aegyptiacus]KAF6466459.1 membrane spanning 4-domains A14 [Rousettus aegyptiacus]
METSSESKRSATHVITIPPDETVLTALPYRPQSSLLDFLKGEPKVLGAIQILLALIIVGIGAIFAFNFFHFSQRFPLVFITGYPFWGAFIFIITGLITGLDGKAQSLEQGVKTMNVISSLVAVAGIALTLISYRYQHQYCQVPSLEGICVVGRNFFNGILSVLLIISVVELSISVTIASFRSKCWARSNEIVFFLPLDVTQDSELSVQEENAIIQFELQEESTSDYSTANVQPVFFGGYTFFKLRVSKSPLAFQQSEKRGSNYYYTSSFVTDEQQKTTPPTSKLYEEHIKPEPLPPRLEKSSSENTTHTEQMNDEDLQLAIQQPSEIPEALTPQELPPQVLPTQTLPLQALPPTVPKFHITPSHGLTSDDIPSSDTQSQYGPPPGTSSQGTRSQETQSQTISSLGTSSLYSASQYMLSQDTLSPNTLSQDISQSAVSQAQQGRLSQAQGRLSQAQGRPSQAQDRLSQPQVLPTESKLLEAKTFHAKKSLSVQQLAQQSLSLQQKNGQNQDQQFVQVSYQDIHSEVSLLTQDWTYEKHQRKKSTKKPSIKERRKSSLTSKRKSTDLSIKDLQSSRRKSLDLHIKAWLSDRRHSTHKQLQLTQTTHRAPDQQDEDELAQGQQSPKRPSQNGHGEDQQDREQPPQTQSEDGQDKAPHQRAEDLKAQEEKLPAQLGQDRRSLDLKTPARQTQDLLKKESLKQKALYKQAPTMQAVPRQHLAWKAQDVPFQGAQYRDIKIREMKSLCEKPSDVRSEDVKSDFHHSSCQSSVQDMYFTYLSNTESDVQQDTSVCSTSYKENPALTSCCLKDQPQSEESD